MGGIVPLHSQVPSHRLRSDLHVVAALKSLIVLTAIWFALRPAAAAELSIPGAGPPTQLIQTLATEFNRRAGSQRIVVPSTVGTFGGLEAARKAGGLARLPRQLSAEELSSGLRQIVIAREPIVFATGADVSVTNLNREQLAGIFSGRIVDWSELGDRAGPVRAFYRHDTADSLRIIRARLPEFARLEFGRNARLLNLDREVIEQLQRFGWGVGWGSAGNVRAAKGLRVLALDGVAPSAHGLRSGRYPLDYEVVLIHSGTLTGTAAEFVAFATSLAGQAVVEAFGAVPVAVPSDTPPPKKY
jgi:phosphate transport system substrate-binding protein